MLSENPFESEENSSSLNKQPKKEEDCPYCSTKNLKNIKDHIKKFHYLELNTNDMLKLYNKRVKELKKSLKEIIEIGEVLKNKNEEIIQSSSTNKINYCQNVLYIEKLTKSIENEPNK
jgi:sulfur transfer protein SufE